MRTNKIQYSRLAGTGLSMIVAGNKEKGLSKPFTEDWQRRLRL
jgi:hypothetical protein